MTVLAATLVQRTRRFVGDWPEQDALSAGSDLSQLNLSVTGVVGYQKGWLIQVGQEACYVTNRSTGVAIPVLRGVRGTVAALHSAGDLVLVRPAFLDIEILDALNSGINASFPFLYQAVVDETTSTDGSITYEYTIPNLNGVPIPYLSRVEFKVTGDFAFREMRDWTVRRGSAPILKLRRPLPAGTLRMYGFGPLPPLSDLNDTLNSLYPTNAEDALTFYAGQYLLASGEAARVREDTGALDAREAANRVGSSMAAAQAVLQRFYQRLQQAQMPPMPKNVVPTI